MLNQAIMLALVCGVIALAYGGFTAAWILRQPDGNERTADIEYLRILQLAATTLRSSQPELAEHY